MPSKQPAIPTMPVRFMIVPVIVGVFSIITGVLSIHQHDSGWGWFLIIGGIVIPSVGYVVRRGAWRNIPRMRERYNSRR